MEAPSIDVHDMHSRQCTDRMGPEIDKQIVATTKRAVCLLYIDIENPSANSPCSLVLFHWLLIRYLGVLTMACYKPHITNICICIYYNPLYNFYNLNNHVLFIAQMGSFENALAIINSFSSTCLVNLSSKPHPPMRELP